MLKYYRIPHDTRFALPDDGNEVDYDEALRVLLSVWRDCDMVRDFLTIPNVIPCRFSTIYVEDTESHKVPMPGAVYLIPAGAEYDDNGNRVSA